MAGCSYVEAIQQAESVTNVASAPIAGSVLATNGFFCCTSLVQDLTRSSAMLARPTFDTRHCRIPRLIAVISFALVLFSAQHLALAARIPAPMCTPDAQSMPAPLQRTPTSPAEIRRDACSVDQGPHWDVLPNQSPLPLNWYQSAADPLWIAQPFLKPVKAASLLSPSTAQTRSLDRAGYCDQIYRPPKPGLGD